MLEMRYLRTVLFFISARVDVNIVVYLRYQVGDRTKVACSLTYYDQKCIRTQLIQIRRTKTRAERFVE